MDPHDREIGTRYVQRTNEPNPKPRYVCAPATRMAPRLPVGRGLGRRSDMSTWRSVASRRATHSPTHRHRAAAAFVSTGVYGHPHATVASPPRPDKAAAAAAYSASCLRRLLPLSPRATLTAGRAAAARLPRPRRHLHRPGHPHGLRRHLVPLFRCRSEAEARGFPSRAGF